jgi:hypothetical protein
MLLIENEWFNVTFFMVLRFTWFDVIKCVYEVELLEREFIDNEEKFKRFSRYWTQDGVTSYLEWNK